MFNICLTIICLITLDSGETPVRIVLCEESPYDLNNCFRPFFSHFETTKFLLR